MSYAAPRRALERRPATSLRLALAVAVASRPTFVVANGAASAAAASPSADPVVARQPEVPGAAAATDASEAYFLRRSSGFREKLKESSAADDVVIDANASVIADGIDTTATSEIEDEEKDGEETHEEEHLRSLSFDYHKEVWPLDWNQDGATLIIASIGLIIAASGGIGGGGILVPIFMLVLKFRPKHAVALSNFTIFGGAIANTMLNARRRHPKLNQPLIDWDIIIMMEPLTIFGAVFGSLISKVLPNILLTVSLVAVLALMGRHTMQKGIKMWRDESKKLGNSMVDEPMMDRHLPPVGGETEMMPASAVKPAIDRESTHSYVVLESDTESTTAASSPRFPTNGSLSSSSSMTSLNGNSPRMKNVPGKITTLTVCFVGTIGLTILKGGGNFASPLGFECGSMGFWLLYFASCPWVFAFVLYFRSVLMQEYNYKIQSGHQFAEGEVQWDSSNAIRYPLLCAVSGLLAGLFGVGGGIVKGPLMLEMGVVPVVASASAAAMILYTSAAASISFIVFGLLHPVYGAVFFVLGFCCTTVGQYTVSAWVKKHNRQSPIVLSIGSVICLSSILVAIESVTAAVENPLSELFRAHGVCTMEA
eukprot:TRINITY_DN15335_c0_g3_i1.p1 TRINITY_DN15335_c0_g3~~TRINITY_DN15335_c0_g3_i1.p1  ORF type:complete len:595 (-),score=94.46 TRINITY_DN15335_c0_g3_i1:112-1896(-)